MSAPATRPPLWLAAATTASFWAVVLGVGRQINIFVNDPFDNDFRVYYAAAKVGLGTGWSLIYDAQELRKASRTFAFQDRVYDSAHYYLHPPLLAWIVTPLTALSEPQAFVVWTVIGAAAFIAAWAIACPFSGLGRFTMLLLGMALWSVEESLRFGQPVLLLLALIALSWQLVTRDRAVLGGALLALAVMLKPQDAILVPVALLISGRTRVFIWFVGWAAALTVAFVLSLGPVGITDFVNANLLVQSNPGSEYDTMAFIFGIGPVAHAVELGLAAAAMFVAHLRRREVDVVFAIGLLGSVMLSPHLHESDYALDVLAAWLVLRSGTSAAHKIWLALGIPAGQFIAIGIPLPQLLWQPGWLVVLARSAGYPVPSRGGDPNPLT